MKKIIVAGFIACLFAGELPAQNLLLNPGLENYITCPGFGQFSSTYINDWNKPSIASTDYYHSNCPGIQPTSQVPHGGNAYFGIIAYNLGQEYREYATGQLSSPLLAGMTYTVQFYVSLNDGYIQAVNELGAYFSSTSPGPFPNSLHIAVTPQIENTTGVLGSDSTWMLVSGLFTAAGGEQYITIGNFHDDATTTVTQVGNVGSFGAYYYVDDISVEVSKIGTGIKSQDETTVGIYPNPFSVSTTIVMNHVRFTPDHPGYDFALYDIAGREIFVSELRTPVSLLDRENLEGGIYFYKVTREQGTWDKGQGTREIIGTGKIIIE